LVTVRREMADSAWSVWPAPAKINLFLRVLGRRQDGYHEIQTLFQLLDWGDSVRISVRGDGRIRRVSASYDVPADADLAVRAACLLQRESGSGLGAEIEVVKRVPPGSGMGGGSSDAATVLLALNYLWGCGLGLRQLAQLGIRLGADVPVFVIGRSALATGIGEQLEPVSLGNRHYVLVFPEVSISTRAVFSDPGLKRDSLPLDTHAAAAGDGGNDCERVVRQRLPAFDRLMKELGKWGPARMTGTGSGVFLAMPDEKSAKRTANALKSLYNVRAVSGIDRSPVHLKLDGA
jgi:4-diphosphocytidyl-2-C-methyl-D-erythritol kinase